MKVFLALLSVIVILFNLTFCAAEESARIPESFLPSSFVTVTDEAEHSELYNPNYTVDEVFACFKEVVLSTEYTENEQSGALVQKWILPIFYSIEGDCSENDKKVITDFIDELNKIDGFPKMYPAESSRQPCLVMDFMSAGKLYDEMGDVVRFERSDGISQFWFLLRVNVICGAKIGYDRTMADAVRTAVLLEEIVNVLGVSNDTETRSDSIVYSGYTEIDTLSEMDWLILRILYNDEIKCGMNEDECYRAIKRIYY